MKTSLPVWVRVAALAGAVLLGACGGGDGGGRTTVMGLSGQDTEAPACSECAPGVVTGIVATGRPVVQARVQAWDSQGTLGQTQTDSQGRYRLVLARSPVGGVLVRAFAVHGGQALMLHNLLAAEEAQAGRRAANLTPLTELVAGDVLGGQPHALRARGEVDLRRALPTTLRAAEARVQALVQPVLNAAGVPADVDLRSSPLVPFGTGLDAALDALDIAPEGGGWKLAWRFGPEVGNMRHYDPASPGASPLPSWPAAHGALAQAVAHASEAMQGVASSLDDLTVLYAAGLPDETALLSHLAADFRHAGLDAATHVRRVWQRVDAVDEGGYSMAHARFTEPVVERMPDADTAWVRFRIVLPAPLPSRAEAMYFKRDGGTWRPWGDQRGARIRLVHVLVLQARPASDVERAGWGELSCASDTDTLGGQVCSLAEGALGLPSGGQLHLGDPAEVDFGTWGWYRSRATSRASRLDAARQFSRWLGAPSARVRRWLAFEVDARSIDPRVMRVRLSGGPLPAGGIDLVPPPSTVNGPQFENWVLAEDDRSDWAGLPWGWCPASIPAQTCATEWAAWRTGRLQADLLDASGGLITREAVDLPPEPVLEGWFGAGWADLDGAAGGAAASALPRLSVIAGLGLDRVLSESDIEPQPWAWRVTPRAVAGDAEVAIADLAWVIDVQRADLAGAVDSVRRRQWLHAATVASAVTVVPARVGWRPEWAVARAVATDELGVRRVHALLPSNPN